MNSYRLPALEELAKLAAMVSAGTKRSPSDAVAYALNLWRESHVVIERLAAEEAGIPGYGSFERTLDQLGAVKQHQASIKERRVNVPMPPKFPASLDDFLDLIVKGKTPADSTKRLRDFFRHLCADRKTDRHTAAANEIRKIKDGDKTGGFFTRQKWLLRADEYAAWWKQHKSASAAESARQRKKKLAG